MKPLTGRRLGAVMAIAMAVAAIAGVAWVFATTSGARWLLTSAIPLSRVSFSAQKIEGRIIDHLLLTEARVNLAQQKLEIGSLELRWKPSLLLAGTVALQELVINGVRIQDNTPIDNKPPNPVWPRVSGNSQLFDGKIARLRVTNLSYRRLQEQPMLVTSIVGAITWQDGALSISHLTAAAPSGQVNGSVSTDFKQPSLTADLAIVLAQPVADMDRFSLQARPGSVSGLEQFAGTVTVVGSAGTRKLLELGGDVGMARNAFNLRRLRLTRPGRKGLISADGSLAFTTLKSILSLQVKVAGLDLAPDLNMPTNLSGSLKFAGDLDSYQGNFALANQAKGWRTAVVSGACQGTREGMKLALLTGKALDGTVAGNLDMNWRDGLVMKGSISGRNINPARIDPAWKGVANFNATGKMAWLGKAPLTGSVSGELLESRLHGQRLTGELQADIVGNNLSLTRLALQGKGFDLRASGELNKKLNLTARISDFSRLIPGAVGTLQAEGWVSWRNRQLSGAVVGAGSKLAYAGTRISGANLTARLEQGTGYPLHVNVSLRDVIHDGYTLNAVTLVADGTLPRHTLNATLRSGGSEARLTVAAGYNAGIWKGDLSRLAVRENNGSWNLTAPAAFSISAEKVSLSTLALSTGAEEHIEVAVDLALNPLNGQVQAQWAGINLALLKPWRPPDIVLEGRVSGRAKGIMLAGQGFELDGNAVLSGGGLHQKRPDKELNLAFKSATASWGWRGETLSGVISLTMAQYGQVRATFHLPLPARFPVAVNPKGPLRASLAGQVQEKGIITALFPGLVQESLGELDAGIDISGTWEAPQAVGKLRLAKAGGYLPTAGIHLKELQLTARLEKNLIRVDSFRAVSGPGHIEGSALINLAGWRVAGYQGTISGENFQTVYFPELRILSTPKLSFEGTPQKFTLRGELGLPELYITDAQSRTVITPSSDVILEGRAAPVAAKTFPLALDVQVRILPGEKVFARIAGIDAQLGGYMDLSFSSLDKIISKGEIKVVKGRYRTYGVDLEIVRGRLFFAGVAIDRPILDFLALRSIGNVRVGVTVTGDLRKPVAKLYSDPPMPDADVLAYIVLGHPLGNSGGQASLLTQATGALLTSGQAAVLQEQLKNYLGLSTLEIQGDSGGTTSSMGYKPLQATPPGAIPSSQQSGISGTVLTVGKYLTPQLYISYGRSLFSGSNLFRLRYDIFRQWQLETQTGGESGVDLYYKLEFK